MDLFHLTCNLSRGPPCMHFREGDFAQKRVQLFDKIRCVGCQRPSLKTPKINMTMEKKQPFEDVSSLKHGDFPARDVSFKF